MRGKYNPEKLLIELLSLEPIEFIGICKIIGVEIYKEEKEENKECGGAEEHTDVHHIDSHIVPREFYEIWCDVCDTVDDMNRTRRRNLGKLIYAAAKKEN